MASQKRNTRIRHTILVLLKSCVTLCEGSLALFIGVLLLSESVAATPTQFSSLFKPTLSTHSRELPSKAGFAPLTPIPPNPQLWGGTLIIAQQPTIKQQDATRAAANRAYQEGMQLFKQGTAEFLRQAITKWEEALPLYQAVGDKKGEAVILSNIGAVYSDLGQKQKALEFYDQSLPLSQEAGDKRGEAVTLNNKSKKRWTTTTNPCP